MPNEAGAPNYADYILGAEKNGELSEAGRYFVVVRICSSRDAKRLFGIKLAYPNQDGRGFNRREFAEKYLEAGKEFELDMKRSGGFIVERV